MRAKDYFKKHQENMKLDPEMAAQEIFVEFNDEMVDIIRLRKSQRDSSVAAVVREQNDKWNALCRIFEERTGGACLEKDRFLKFWVEAIPDMRDLLTPRRSLTKDERGFLV